MYNTINHFAEPGFKAKAMAEFFTSRAHTAEIILSVIYDAVDNDMSAEDFIDYVEDEYQCSRNAIIIIEGSAVTLGEVITTVISVSNDPVKAIINWQSTEVVTIDGSSVSIMRILEKLAALTREGYIASAGFTVISQEGTISDFRDLLSERLSNAYNDVSGQLSYWASMIRSKLDRDSVIEKALRDMTPDVDNDDRTKAPAFDTTPYAGLSSASPVELAGLELSFLGFVPSIIGNIYAAYFSGVFWVLSKVISGIGALSKKVASGFLPYEAVIFSEGKAGTFKYGAWIQRETVHLSDIPRIDERWTNIDAVIPIAVDETLALDLSFGQLLFYCSGNTSQMDIECFFKPKVIIPTSSTVIWGSYSDGSIAYPPDPIKTLSSISNLQAYRSIKYASLYALAVSRIALQELSSTERPAGSISLLSDDTSVVSATDIAQLLGDTSVAVDFIQGQSLASAMDETLSNFCQVIASFVIEKKFYPVDFEFLPFTSSMIGWDEYSFDLTSEEDARAKATRQATNAFLVAAAAAVAIKYGPKLFRAITNLYSRSLSKSYSAMAKAASGRPLTSADILAIRRASSRIPIATPASAICPIEINTGSDVESNYARLYSLIAGVNP